MKERYLQLLSPRSIERYFASCPFLVLLPVTFPALARLNFFLFLSSVINVSIFITDRPRKCFNERKHRVYSRDETRLGKFLSIGNFLF